MFPTALKSLSDQERHDYVLKTFVLNKNAAIEARRHKRDIDVIKEHHRFLWDTNDPPPETWEERLARRYYDKLFKEYCIANLSRYKENKIAMRWRTEAEVVAGIGQFQCGSRNCEQREELRSWEVNFVYLEQGLKKNAMIKLRLCAEHSTQLNYTSRKREIKRMKHAEKRQAKSNRRKEAKSAKTEQSHSSNKGIPEMERAVREQDAHDSNITEIDKETTGTVNNAVDDVWAQKPQIESEMNLRETDFERYLEDLLL